MSDLLALATRARDAAQDSIQEHEKVGHNPAAGLQIPSKIIQIQVRVDILLARIRILPGLKN